MGAPDLKKTLLAEIPDWRGKAEERQPGRWCFTPEEVPIRVFAVCGGTAGIRTKIHTMDTHIWPGPEHEWATMEADGLILVLGTRTQRKAEELHGALRGIEEAVRRSTAMLAADEREKPDQARNVLARSGLAGRRACAAILYAIATHDARAAVGIGRPLAELPQMHGAVQQQALLDEWLRMEPEATGPVWAGGRALDAITTRTAHRILTVMEEAVAKLARTSPELSEVLTRAMAEAEVAETPGKQRSAR